MTLAMMINVPIPDFGGSSLVLSQLAIMSSMQRQARAPQTQPFGAEAFDATDGTVLRWLGMAGF